LGYFLSFLDDVTSRKSGNPADVGSYSCSSTCFYVCLYLAHSSKQGAMHHSLNEQRRFKYVYLCVCLRFYSTSYEQIMQFLQGVALPRNTVRR